MDEYFRSCAARLSGQTSVVLGWRPEDFWQATPREVALIFDVLREQNGEEMPADGVLLSQMMENDPDG